MLFWRFLGENPVALQQWMRFRRLGPRWWILLVLVWLPATWFLRFKLADFFFNNVTAGSWPIAAEFAILFLNFIFRADVPLIVLTYSLLMPAAEWRKMRAELVLTLLKSRELLEGLLFVPFGLLFLFNAVGAPFFYADLYASVSPDCPSRLWAWAFALTLGGSAFVEDLLFGAICLLALIQERLRGNGHTPMGLVAAAGLILRTGLMVGLLAMTQMFMEGMMTGMPGSDFARQFLTNVISMAMVLAYELRVAAKLWKASMVELESWSDLSGE